MKRDIKSYVLRGGRISSRQDQGLTHYLPLYQLPADGINWDFAHIFGRRAETVVEIGFGMGASLVITAQQNPHINFIGIEVHRAGIGSLAAAINELGLTNIKIAPYDAVSVFQQQIAAQSLHGIQIFFPDPWPKKRHQKRRLIQPKFIQQIIPALQPEGFIHCATDWEDYAHQMLAVLSSESCLQNQADTFSPRLQHRPLTKFEQRGQALGHGVWDLLFHKVMF